MDRADEDESGAKADLERRVLEAPRCREGFDWSGTRGRIGHSRTGDDLLRPGG
jgi:hypothetical protein